MPRQEAEHQTFHQGECDVFRHRTIPVDALTTNRCVGTHTVSFERGLWTALQPKRQSVGCGQRQHREAYTG